VQLIYLLTPFMVAILGALFFGEPTPPFTYPALMLSSIGAALTLVADWSHVWAGFSGRDFLGLGVALVSMLALALYFQLVRRSSRREAGRGLIMVQQGLAMVVTYAFLTTVSGEDWTAWTRLSPAGWATVAWVLVVVFAFGNLLQVTALGGANAALVTSLMPLRLVSAIAVGWWLLGERLTTLLQWVGAFVVLATVSAYLWVQQRAGSGA
jgi:drug/metabolite transporter (DMT)-like permease